MKMLSRFHPIKVVAVIIILSISCVWSDTEADDILDIAPSEIKDSEVSPPSSSAIDPIPQGSNEMTNVEFKMDGVNSRLVLSAKHDLSYREVVNSQMNQVVYYFDNTSCPARLQRAFDTSEFISPVALFTLLQMPGETPVLTKLIVQLREKKSASVRKTENGLLIDFPPPDKSTEPKIILGDGDQGEAKEENLYGSTKVFSGKSIQKLEIKNSDIQDVLRLIAKTSGYNIVVGDDVRGKVGTLSLENVPWDQAFALVLQSKKLGYVRQGNVIRVGTLASLKAEKEEAAANEESRIRVEPLRTVVIPISYAQAATFVARTKQFLSERGSTDVDARTNSLIIKDIDSVVNRIQKLVAALDTEPSKVSITGRVVELSSSFSRDIGLSSGSFTQGINTAGLNITPSIAGSAGGGSSFLIGANRLGGLLANLKLGESNEQVRVLANPNVSVVANHPAKVSSTISTYLRADSVTAGGVVVQQFRAVNAVLTLDVTPIVAADGGIFLTVKLNNDIPSGFDTSTPTINSRTIDTQILLDNGDTAVIGGIFRNQSTMNESGLGYLMRIPILGRLFSGETKTEATSETFLFLTARISNADESLRKNF